MRHAWIAAPLLVGALAARAAVVEDAIPLAPHGDAQDGHSGAPVALSPRALLVPAEGADGTPGGADAVVLLVTGIGGTPGAQALAAPYPSTMSGGLVRLTAARAVRNSAGPDGVFRTADDELLLFDELGAGNTVTAISVGFLESGDLSLPVPLAHDRVALASMGPDGQGGTPDDLVVVVAELGGAPTLRILPVPNLGANGSSSPVALGPSALLVTAAGPDGMRRTADDEILVFQDVFSGGPPRVVATPYLGLDPRVGRPVRVGVDVAVLGSHGPDAAAGTADDAVHLVGDLFGTPFVTTLGVPHLLDFGGGLVALGPERALVSTEGADGMEPSADDALAALVDLRGSPQVLSVPLGALRDGTAVRPVALDAERVAVAGFGADAMEGTADDEVVIVDEPAGAASLARVAVPALAFGAAGLPVAVSARSFLIASGGPDAAFASGTDDALRLVEGVGATPSVEDHPIGGAYDDVYSLAHVPVVLGGGRAAQLVPGADATYGQGDDDELRVLAGIADERGLRVERLRVRFDAARPEKGEKLKLGAALALDGLPPPGASDLTLTLGAVSQTIAAADLVAKRNSLVYKDRKGERGFVTKLRWSARKGTLAVRGKGLASGLEAQDPGYVPFAVEFASGYFADAVEAETVRKGLRWKAPR